MQDGRELIDGIASWWTACHGYNHPHIVAEMTRQLNLMPHVMFGGLVHEPARRLAERLARIAPGDLNHVFFVDSGSVAVEVAMKMAVQYWLNKGVTGRHKFVHFRQGYHGDTMACMAVCDPDEGMHAHFRDWLPQNIVADLPRDEATAAAFSALLEENKHSIAAVLIEPLVQGAGGMKFHAAATLKHVADLCERQGVLLIADEIFTGFGRTGTMFACEQAAIVPDIMCLGKGLTGGAIGLAATLARPHVYRAFLSDDPSFALMHGPTFMANPLACAAANASLDLFDREPRLAQVTAIEQELAGLLEPCRSLAGVVDVRVRGAIGVVQLNATCDMRVIRHACIDRGVWVRPFRDILYVTPPLNINSDDLRHLGHTVLAVLQEHGGQSQVTKMPLEMV